MHFMAADMQDPRQEHEHWVQQREQEVQRHDRSWWLGGALDAWGWVQATQMVWWSLLVVNVAEVA